MPLGTYRKAIRVGTLVSPAARTDVGTIASSHGNARLTPRPRSTVRREMCVIVPVPLENESSRPRQSNTEPARQFRTGGRFRVSYHRATRASSGKDHRTSERQRTPSDALDEGWATHAS